MNKLPCYVGIDTSNYTTSAALCTKDGKIVANLKLPLPVKAGEVGLRQSDAVFAHVKNLPVIIEMLTEKLREYEPIAIGVSEKPRDAQEAYMPCFLSGVAAARAFAAGAGNIPLHGFSHQSGHIMAAVYSSGHSELLESDFIAFHVSGGTTEALLVRPRADGFDVSIIGETLDLNAGQAVDRAGVMLGVKFPCGPALEEMALLNDKKIPRGKISVKGGSCNLSGLENLARRLYSDTEDKSLTAAFVFDFIGRTLLTMTENLRAQYGDLPVLYAGGVMSNSIIKKMLAVSGHEYFAEPAFSSDNAAGIALLCRKAMEGK